MIKYVTSRPLWFNILIAIGIVVILFLGFMFSLNWITKHGESSTVPSVTGKNINEVSKLLSDAGFELVIQDSLFIDSLPRGVVIKQIPEADEVVKVNRTIYVTINRFVAPDISMPNIVGYSLRNAELTLQSHGLKLGDTTTVPYFAKGSVTDMMYQGKQIKPGDKIKVGSVIDLVVSGGMGTEEMAVPKLIGLQLGEAKILLEAKGIILDVIVPVDLADNDQTYIYDQRPRPKTEDGIPLRIRAGQTMGVYVQTEPVKDTSEQIQQQNPY